MLLSKSILTISLCFLSCTEVFSQLSQKQLKAERTTSQIKIDGALNEEAWKLAETGTDFIEIRPVPGAKEKKGQTTEVKILYDDFAVYVYARMNDTSADSIARQVVPRDRVGNADFIGVIFDTYYDRINANGFYVTAAGSQYDAKYSQTGNEDSNWNAVWFSAVKIDEKGWSAEMKIPYSALRFSSKDIQTWGINFTRRRQIFNQQTFWNFVDPKVSGFINQEGQLTNIKNIEAPVRLSVSPYIANTTSHFPYNTAGVKDLNSRFNGGMDVKYGLNDAFTLDMTLVPDFGQVQSDNRILNLSPFDVRFDEQRQFFTEGTEMFNKGDLFYSRKVGIEPEWDMPSLNENEEYQSRTQGSKILNATKVSGRTAKGLGIGFFNSVTNKMSALVRDTINGAERTVETQPLTNYNIFVLDQSLKNNSSLTFLNANTMRQGKAYDANVSAVLFKLNDKKNNYFVAGEGKLSNRTLDSRTGLNYELGFGKQSGSFNWEFEQELSDRYYNQSDLGFFTMNNYLENQAGARYNIYTPTKWFNQLETWTEVSYVQRLKERQFQSFRISPGFWMQFKNFWTLNMNATWRPEGNDFYEPRTDNRVFRTPGRFHLSGNFNTNRSKRYQIGGFLALQKNQSFNGRAWGWGTWQTWRVNDKLSLSSEIVVEPGRNIPGWVDNYTDSNQKTEIIFSTYDRETVETILSTRYTFSPRMGLSLRARHYWSERLNKEFYSLNMDGTLSEYLTYPDKKHQNYNVFNVDMIYTWQFAPGSELNLTYKNVEDQFGDRLYGGYGRNLSETLNAPQNNSLSVKLLYYIDYLDLKRKRPRG